jgi:tetratricopeptide (TPR) repeat protein
MRQPRRRFSLKSYLKRHNIAERLAAHDPANTQWQRDLSVSYEKIGDVQMTQGDLPNALTSYKKSLEIREKLVRARSGQYPVAARSVGQLREDGRRTDGQGDPPAALSSYKKSLQIREKLAAHDPINSQWQHDLSICRSVMRRSATRRWPRAILPWP